MRKIRDVLRLSAGGMSKRKIAISLSVGATAAGEYPNASGRLAMPSILEIAASRVAR
jgi:hypothetical protein